MSIYDEDPETGAPRSYRAWETPLTDALDEAAQVCPVPLPEVDELLADPEVAAEADRILAGEGGEILGIPFAPKRETERGE